MKAKTLIRSAWTIIVLALLVSAGRVCAQTTSTSTATSTTSQTAWQVLNNIYLQANLGITPLNIYPPGYLDYLLALSNSPYPPPSATVTAFKVPRGSNHLVPGDKARMKWLDASFIMGSPTTEAERNSDENQYNAIISYGFYMGNFEVTQYEYQQVMGNNPSYFTSANGYTDDLNRPVENVTWEDATNYCYLITQQALANGSIQPGWQYRLPTEAEWEYSCRAGSKATVFDIEGPQSIVGLVSEFYYVPSVIAEASGGSTLSFRVHNNSTTGQLFAYLVQDSGNHYTYQAGGPQLSATGLVSGSGTVSGTYYGNIVAGSNYNVGFSFQTGGNDPGIALEDGDYIRVTTANPGAFSFGNAIHGGDANFDDYYEYDSSVGTIDVANPTVPYADMTTNVGNYLPNGFGLYDMHGNVAEWCEDWYGAYPTAATVDPQGPASGTLRVVRGGSWADHGVNCRSAARLGMDPDTATNTIGFRIVLAPVTPDWKTTVETQPSIKTYGVPPVKDPNKDNLVLITHGWQQYVTPIAPLPDVSWMDTMSNDIMQYLGTNSSWQVYGYNWVPNAWKLTPDEALNNAKQEGISLGNALAAQGWTHIHFIAHSAGAGLIQTAAQIVKAQSPSTVIQCTFLDPYVGTSFAGQSQYGIGVDWSDRYSVHGDNANALGPYTDIPLDAAYNVDVTGLDPSVNTPGLFVGPAGQLSCALYQSSHGWPITFYENTITGNNVTPDYSGFGFPLSAEAGGLQGAISQYPVGNVNSVNNLGITPSECTGLGIRQAVPVTQVDFSQDPVAAKSTTGTVIQNAGQVTLITGSPAWISLVPTNTTPVNLITFDADFESGQQAAGLLSVYWDTNVIGTVDERTVGEGDNQYSLRFPVTESNSTYVLSFRVDPFTNITSTVIISNVVLSAVGVTQPFTLAVTTNTMNGMPVYELTGESGFDYGLEASSDLTSTNWTQIAVLENTNGVVDFYDPTATNYTCRFYRATAPQ